MVNILLNACKHSSINSEVDLEVSSTEDKIYFKIEDYGEGINKDDVAAIFETFYRADSSRNRDTGGVGIGLSLAKALVDIHHGDIKVESQRRGRLNLYS